MVSGGRRKITDKDLERIKEMWLAGFSSIKIAKEFGVDKKTILTMVKKLGLPKHEYRRRSKYDYDLLKELWDMGLLG